MMGSSFKKRQHMFGAALVAALGALTMAAAPTLAYGGHAGGGHMGGGAHFGGGHFGGGHFSGSHFSGGHFGGGAHFGGHGFYGHGYGRGYYGHAFYGGCCWGGYWSPWWPYAGFGYFYDDALAAPYIGLGAWDMAYDADLDEADLRAQQNAMVQATTAPLNQPIQWDDGTRSGSVIPLRDGHTPDGRSCREFQQQITIDGRQQSAFGTACQKADGSWEIVPSGDQ